MASAMTPPHNRRLHDETGNRIVPGQKLGEGGEGAVYLVEGDPGSVMKIWHPGRTPTDADAKLHHLLRNPVEPDLGATWQITWPQRLVQENGVTVGYTMPLLDPGASWEPIVEYYNRRAAQTTEQEQGRELRIDDRVRMATNLALGFRAVHAAGYVIGDVNEKNVEVNRQNDIAMVDCDSYGFTDAQTGRTFVNNMGRPEFQAPEAQDDYTNRTQNHDRFGLAVIIFHLLTGYHPYTVVNQPDHPQPVDRIRAWLFPPSNRAMVEAPAPYNVAWAALTDGQKDLFQRCFDWQYQGQPRPTPEEWLEALQEMPEEATPTPALPSQQPTPQPTRPVYEASPVPPPPPQSPLPYQPHVAAPAPAQAPPPTTSADDANWLYWALAVGGYGVLIPLAVFSQFRPWWWLALMLAAAGLFYLPVRRLLQRPITTTRWIIISIATLFSIWFLLGLIARAMETWPWWFWLGAGAVAAFVLLVPGRRRLFEMLRSRNARRRWMAIGAVSLLASFILWNLGTTGVREWLDWREEQRWQAALNATGPESGIVAATASAAVNAGGVVAADTVTVVPASNPSVGDDVAPTAAPIPAGPPASFPTPEPTAEPERRHASRLTQPGLTLAEFDTDGLQTDVLALFQAGNAGDGSTLYSAAGSRWDATGALLDGDPGFGETNTPIVRIWYSEDTGILRLNDAGALALERYFEPEGDGNELKLWVKTSEGQIEFPVADSLDSAGADYINLQVPPKHGTIIADINPGDRFILALARPLPKANGPDTSPALPASLQVTPTLPPAITATLPLPTATLTPTEWLYPNATHSIVADLALGKKVRLQGCYLGNLTTASKFRLASWDVWDPSLYGRQLKFVKIITNNGARITLERGLCYDVNVTKHVDSPDEYVCLDSDAVYSQQYPCDHFRENETIPTFILHPDERDHPDDFTGNFVRIDARP